jgi:hypothetical protein
MCIMDDIIKDIESRKNGDKIHDFVLDDAIYFIKKAKEALEEGLQDPQKWYNNEQINSKTFYSLLPHIYLTQQKFAYGTSSE